MAPALFSFAACLAVAHSARVESDTLVGGMSYKEMYEAEVERRLSGTPKVAFPDEMTLNYKMVKYLGAGSFGESWLVKNQDRGSSLYNEEVVMKFLYVEEGPVPEHLTWRMALRDRFMQKDAQDAARECDIAADLRKQGKGSVAPGSSYVMSCYGHNVPSRHEDVSSRLDSPLFLLLENCGGEDLTKFMRRKAKANELSIDLVTGLFKQILQGLDFMASLGVPWLHHDLKPDNIVVNTHDDGSHSAHLIDFGATVKASQDFMCKLTASTLAYAPSEWGVYKSQTCPTQNFLWSPDCTKCATAFDMFAASAILLELVTGSRLYDLKGTWGFRNYRYANVDAYAKDPSRINSKAIPAGEVQSGTRKYYAGLMEAFLLSKSPSASFFSEAMAGLRSNPAKRPTAAELLKHSIFTSGRKKITLVSIKPLAPCRYKEGEAVEIFLYDTQSYAEGTVLTVERGGMTKVKVVDLRGKETRYVLSCYSPRLRKLSQKQPLVSQSGFRPAAGSERAGFDEVTRMSKDSSCPSLCEDCQELERFNPPGQYVCWSPMPLDDVSAQKALNDNSCSTTSTFKKTTPKWTFYGYLCSR